MDPIPITAEKQEQESSGDETPTGDVKLCPKPEPPIVGKVTHRSIELIWKHVKEKLDPKLLYRFRLQEADKDKSEWGTVYSGNSMKKVVKRLQPNTEYNYRLCYASPGSERSEYSDTCTVRTTEEVLDADVLHKAIYLDRRDDVKRILSTSDGQKLLKTIDRFGNLPLMTAVMLKNLEMVNLLILNGADVNDQNESGKTALMIAAYNGSHEIVTVLRDFGALYDKADKSGSYATNYAAECENSVTLEWMLHNGAKTEWG